MTDYLRLDYYLFKTNDNPPAKEWFNLNLSLASRFGIPLANVMKDIIISIVILATKQ